ncbi:MAG: ABC transporter permease [Niabella sp.]
MAYSQSRALWAISKASFKAILSQPTSIFFSLLFPIVFILIFGAFADRPAKPFMVAVENAADKDNNTFYDSLKANPLVKIIPYSDTASLNEDLRKGRLTAVLRIGQKDSTGLRRLTLLSGEADGGAVQQLQRVLDYQAMKIELADAPNLHREFMIDTVTVPGKKYRTIDFVLPGQLGFSVLFATLFGIAFLFFNLREQLVLKRFYASPVSKLNILVGIGASRLFYQLINVAVLILVGHFFLNFTLVNGALTFVEMMLLSVYMLFLLMGAGLIISSVAKSDFSIPLMINLFGFPQILLSGTFFPIDVFPDWMQRLCMLLPLTQFNDAMRKISFEGLHLYDCWREIGALGIWILIIYVVLGRVMKWE